MPQLCYHASQEQFSPSELLRLVILAEQAGFDGIHSSDHFHPWSKRQGQSGFTFSWIAAALQATSLPFSMVCAPGQRYHPAILAQAFATLAEMFPGRINFELGSGEAINELITGEPWPPKAQRNERLRESVELIRRLLDGEELSYKGTVQVHQARLFTRPRVLPQLLCAAISKETAEWAGGWAGGLLTTVEKDNEKIREKVQAFRDKGGVDKPVYLQFAFSYGRDRTAAELGAFDQWRCNILPAEQLASISSVAEFDKLGEQISLKELLDAIEIFTDMKALWKRLGELRELNPDQIILHNINRNHEEFIEDFKAAKMG